MIGNNEGNYMTNNNINNYYDSIGSNVFCNGYNNILFILILIIVMVIIIVLIIIIM